MCGGAWSHGSTISTDDWSESILDGSVEEISNRYCSSCTSRFVFATR